MGLRYAVVTSVDRDDLADGGAGIFAETIREIRVVMPDTRVEVLIPDFKGDAEALHTVLDARPDVLNHNTETVPRLYRMARSGGKYARTLELLDRARRYAPEIPTKTGLMVGLGEEHDELVRGVPRSARRRRLDPDDRPVPAPFAGACPDDPLLPPRRVRASSSASRSTSGSSTSRPARSCAARTTRTNRPMPTTRNTRSVSDDTFRHRRRRHRRRAGGVDRLDPHRPAGPARRAVRARALSALPHRRVADPRDLLGAEAAEHAAEDAAAATSSRSTASSSSTPPASCRRRSTSGTTSRTSARRPGRSCAASSTR